MLRYVAWAACLALCFAEVGIAETGDEDPVQGTTLAVEGRALDFQGRPVPDAKAWLKTLPNAFAWQIELLPDGAGPAPLQRVQVDGQGRFWLTAPGPGLYAVRVEAPGYLPLEYVLEPLLHDTGLPTAFLRPDEGIVVEVRTAKGDLAEGARVVARWRDGGPWTLDHIQGEAWGPATRRTQTGSDGAAILPYVSGEELRIHVILPEHALWMGLVKSQDVDLDVRLEATSAAKTVTVTVGEEPLPSALLTHDKLPLTRTDDRGRASLRPFKRPETLVLRTVEGRREAVIWKPEAATFFLAATRWRSGRVVDGIHGRPVPGALVWSPKDRHAVQADAKGRFQWPVQRPAGALRAASPGYLPARIHDGDGGSKSLDWVLQPAAQIAGRVVTEVGQPASGASVELLTARSGGFPVSLPRRWETVSQADGSFQFQGLQPDQPFEVWARQDGWVPTYGVVSTSVDEDEVRKARSMELVLKRGLSLRGRVVDGASQAIAGAAVEIFSQPADGSRSTAIDDDGRSAAVASTDAQGGFEITNVPSGQHLLLLSASGWAPRMVPRLMLDDGPRGASRDLGDLVLETGQTLFLDLVDADGNAVSGAEVSLLWGLEQAPTLGRQGEVQRRITSRQDLSNPQGRVQVDDLPSGRLTVTVSHPDFTPLERNLILPSELVTLTLSSGLKLSGRVVDTEDTGLPGLEILAETKARSLGSSPLARDLNEPIVRAETKTDATGHFELVGIKPGTVAVTVRRSTFVLAQRELALPEDVEPEPLHVVIDPGIDFQGKVIDDRGQAVAGVLVFMGYRDDPSFRLGLITDAEGQFWVRRAPRGVASLRAQGGGGERARIEIQVEPGMDPVVLTMEAERTLEGQVVDPEGRGVAEAHLHFSTPKFSYRPPTNAEGRFSIPLKGEGQISLTASRPDMGWVTHDVELPETGEVEAVELVLPRGARIVGKVRGVSEDEMRRLKTHGIHKTPVQGLGAVHREGRVDPDASFEIRGFMPGRVSVYAEVDGSMRRARESVEIPPGVDEITVDLDLGDAGLTLSGRVFHNSEPAHTALVIPGHIETDAEGRFRLEGIQAGSVQLALLGPWGQHNHSLQMQEDSDIEIHIDSYGVSGTVVDGSGQPLADVNVECWLQNNSRSSCDHATDVEGRFDLRELPPGQYQFFFYKEGYGRGQYEASIHEDVSDLLITLGATR